MNKKLKTTLIVLGSIVAIIAFVIIMAVRALIQYHDKNTWATISVVDADTGETIKEKECLKGDWFTLDGTTINIGRIEHDGALTFTTNNGTLYDEAGNNLSTVEIIPGNEYHFAISPADSQYHRTYIFSIISNRYY